MANNHLPENCYYCGWVTEPAPAGVKGAYDQHASGIHHDNIRTKDHVISRKYRQSGQQVPVVIACGFCNSQKGDGTVEEFVRKMEQRISGGFPRSWNDVKKDKARSMVDRWHEGKIKNFRIEERHFSIINSKGLYQCRCGQLSAVSPPCASFG